MQPEIYIEQPLPLLQVIGTVAQTGELQDHWTYCSRVTPH